MRTERLTVRNVAIAWAVFSFAAAFFIPDLDSHTRWHPAVTITIAIGVTLFFIATPIALFRYFNRAWKRVNRVPNRTVYTVWLGLETIAGIGFVSFVIYASALAVLTAVRH